MSRFLLLLLAFGLVAGPVAAQTANDPRQLAEAYQDGRANPSVNPPSDMDCLAVWTILGPTIIGNKRTALQVDPGLHEAFAETQWQSALMRFLDDNGAPRDASFNETQLAALRAMIASAQANGSAPLYRMLGQCSDNGVRLPPKPFLLRNHLVELGLLPREFGLGPEQRRQRTRMVEATVQTCLVDAAWCGGFSGQPVSFLINSEAKTRILAACEQQGGFAIAPITDICQIDSSEAQCNSITTRDIYTVRMACEVPAR